MLNLIHTFIVKITKIKHIMTLHNLPLYNFGNGTFMIIIFALVCVALVIALFMMMGNSKKVNDDDEKTEEN